MINQKLYKYLQEHFWSGRDGFKYFVDEVMDEYGKHHKTGLKGLVFTSLKYSDDWRGSGYGEYKNVLLEHAKTNKINCEVIGEEISIFDFIYTVCQFFTFEGKSTNILLYRGVTSKKEDIDKIKSQNKITTHKLSSFTESKQIAREFAISVDLKYKYGLFFETSINSKDIWMTHKDWIEYNVDDSQYKPKPEETDKDLSWEYEFIFINQNMKSINVKVLGEFNYDSLESGSK